MPKHPNSVHSSCYIYQKTTKYQWYLLGNYVEAWIEWAIQGNQAVHGVKEPTGELVNMVVSEFVHNDFLKQQLNNFSIAINSALLTSLKAAGLFLGALIVLLCYRGKLQTINKDVRGALFLEAKHLKKFLKKHKK